jgi:hypothetical protein
MPHRTLIVSDKPEAVRTTAMGDNVVFADRSEFNRLHAIFHQNAGLPNWIVYDAQGQLKGVGRFDSDAISYFIETLVNGGAELTADRLLLAAKAHFTPSECRRLRGHLQPLRKGSRLVVLVAKMCSSCSESAMLTAASAVAKDRPGVVLLLGGLHRTDGDLITTNFRLPFECVEATSETNAWWEELVSRYGLAALNGSVLALHGDQVVGAARTPTELAVMERGI